MRRLKSTQGKHDEFLDLRELGLLYRLRPTNKSTKQSYRNDVNLTIVFLFFAYGSRLVADLILKNSVFHLSIETKVNIKLATDVICNERLELDGKSILCSHLSIGSTQNANTKNSFVFALSLHQTISENSAFWPKHKK